LTCNARPSSEEEWSRTGGAWGSREPEGKNKEYPLIGRREARRDEEKQKEVIGAGKEVAQDDFLLTKVAQRATQEADENAKKCKIFNSKPDKAKNSIDDRQPEKRRKENIRGSFFMKRFWRYGVILRAIRRGGNRGGGKILRRIYAPHHPRREGIEEKAERILAGVRLNNSCFDSTTMQTATATGDKGMMRTTINEGRTGGKERKKRGRTNKIRPDLPRKSKTRKESEREAVSA